MLLVLHRVYKKPTYTIGRLYVNGTFFSNTLEDTVRDYSKSNWKVAGATAIPYGDYSIKLKISPTFSPRFSNRPMPYLCDVPQFSDVLIHSGNTAEDTRGCILLGDNTEKGKVTNSKATVIRLLDTLDTLSSDEKITISIVEELPDLFFENPTCIVK